MRASTLGQRPTIWIVALIAYLALFAGQTWVTREVFVETNPGANDYYPRWLGGCVLLWEGLSPYSEETTQRIQRGIYGRPAKPGEDQAAYAYPLHTLWFTWPTCLTRDFSIVQAAWMTLLVHASLAGTILARKAAGWGPSTAIWAATLVWSVFVYPNTRAILLGQLSLLVFVFLMAALVLLRAGHPGWAGMALAFATIKPQMSFLIIGWLLWWSIHSKRGRAVVGFVASLAAMLAVVSWLDPTWWSGFLDQLQRYPSYTELGSAIWIMTSYYLGTPPVVEWIVSLLGAAGLLWIWWRFRASSFGWMLWVTSLTALGTHFLAPRTATTHFAVLTLPLFLLFEWWRRKGLSAAWALGTLGAVLLGSWALFVWTVEGNQESAINYLPIPLVLFVVLLARRHALAEVGEPT